MTSGLHSEAAGKPSEERFILTQWGAVPSTAWFAIAFVIFFSTFFSYFLVPFGQKYLQPTTMAMYNYLQPVTASLIAVAASHSSSQGGRLYSQSRSGCRIGRAQFLELHYVQH